MGAPKKCYHEKSYFDRFFKTLKFDSPNGRTSNSRIKIGELSLSEFHSIIYLKQQDSEKKQLFHTGFLKKDASFPKIKSIPDLLKDDKEGKVM